MFGKMSVGVLITASTPNIKIRIASTTNVYGLRSARRTIATMLGLSKLIVQGALAGIATRTAAG